MTPPETQEIHGHAVLQMMLDSGQNYSRATLLEAIHEKFGKDSRFIICSGGNMTASELIDALAAKGKFVGEVEAFTFDPGTMCEH